MLIIRPATVNDASLLRTLIRELAEFEHELDSVAITEAELERDGFGDDPKFRALIAEWDSQAAGYALFFDFYSTWNGRQMFLEDVFVREQFRGKGIGMGLLAKVAQIAEQEQCRGMRWEVLGWNEPAIKLYRALGAEFLDDWKLVLLLQPGLHQLAEKR